MLELKKEPISELELTKEPIESELDLDLVNAWTESNTWFGFEMDWP